MVTEVLEAMGNTIKATEAITEVAKEGRGMYWGYKAYGEFI